MLALFLCGLIVMTSIIGGVISFSPVPYWDMWDGYIDFYSKVLAGDYSAWWAPHNEHRIVLSRLFFWGDIRWFGGLSYSLIVINYLLAAAGCIVFVQFLNEAFKPLPNKSTRPFFMCVLVGWLFCWSQHENFTVGFQSQFFMAQLLPLCAFYFIYKMSSAPEKSTQYFVIASIFGVLAAGTMANGIITGVGPRYCPSIETKIVRFPDKERHQLFIEPEGLDTEEMYVQGMSTSMPIDVQMEFLRTIPGLENVRIMRPGYAIEYDCINPLQLKPSLEFKKISGFFSAGQTNGTS